MFFVFVFDFWRPQFPQRVTNYHSESSITAASHQVCKKVLAALEKFRFLCFCLFVFVFVVCVVIFWLAITTASHQLPQRVIKLPHRVIQLPQRVIPLPQRVMTRWSTYHSESSSVQNSFCRFRKVPPEPQGNKRPCGLKDKALVFGTKDCRFESCQGHAVGTA